MKKIIDLFRPCAERMRETYDLNKTAAVANNKITCARCNRRRYGSTYEVTPKKRNGALSGLVDAAKKLNLKRDVEGSL